MAELKSLADLVGEQNILTKEDLSILQGKPIKVYRLDGRVMDAIVYSENNYDFTLVFPMVHKNNSKENQFVFHPLQEGTIAKQSEKHLFSDEEYLLTKFQSFGFISKELDPRKYDELLSSFVSVYKNRFENYLNAVYDGTSKPSLNVDKPFKRFYETTIAHNVFNDYLKKIDDISD